MNLGSLRAGWVTGAGGLIGSELVRTSPPEFECQGLTRGKIDLLDFKGLETLFRKEFPSAIIHCAAMSRSGDCAREPQLARRINVEATAHLTQLAGDIPFVFFSTDLVFDGAKGGYVETDRPNPLSFYAETKVAAEEIVRRNPRHVIVRISLSGGTSRTGDRGFNEEIKNAWRKGKTLNLFVDEFRCPSAAPVIARAVWELVAKRATGTFHLCGAEKLSRYEIGRFLAEKHPELQPKIVAASRKDYPGPPRPPDTSFDCSKAQQLLSFQLPRFSDWLKQDQSGF
jgi:dTDP-4-dehydrorhamnose reductase